MLARRSKFALLFPAVMAVVVTLVPSPTRGFASPTPIYSRQMSQRNVLSSSSSSSRVTTAVPTRRRGSTIVSHHRQDPFIPSSALFAATDGPLESSSSAVETAVVRIGDDAAYFSLADQKWSEWIQFTIATATVLAVVGAAWIWPGHGGDAFVQTIQSTLHTTDPAVTVTAMLVAFAVAHSGLAGLRTYAEPITGARAWRVLFAVVSLPLALSCISYFVNHAHDGVQLWPCPVDQGDATSVAFWHAALFMTNFVSFLFLYPSTFNLLEIAAIQPPQLHLYAPTGIIRITRHPQAVGQCLWCAAHTLYLGTSTALAASTVLVLHHAFSVYHGDRRLRTRHGEEAFEYIAKQTSVVPFAAILEGRQELPPDCYKEFLRLPYLFVIVGTTAAYFAHPYMQAGAALLHW